MAIPNNVYFGPENITFGDVRANDDPLVRMRYLQKRLDSFFIYQIDQLENKSPFVKAMMCCIAMETLGGIFFKKENNDGQAALFIKVAAKIDQKLSRPLDKKFKENYTHQWPEKVKLDANTRAGILYSYLRNTMMHGYYAQGVYLTDQEGYTWAEHPGYLTLNPNWLWEQIKIQYNFFISSAINIKNKEISYRLNALAYIEDILK
jgi:hypothetical protein